MGFMQAYKRLDNLCKDMNGIGVSGYIADMEQAANGEYRVCGWENDYLNLKRYRYIRNRIAHDNFAGEDNMCAPGDSDWLEGFYQRILTQNDPLAVFYKASKPQPAPAYVKAKPTPPPASQNAAVRPEVKTSAANRAPVMSFRRVLLIALPVILFIAYIGVTFWGPVYILNVGRMNRNDILQALSADNIAVENINDLKRVEVRGTGLWDYDRLCFYYNNANSAEAAELYHNRHYYIKDYLENNSLNIGKIAAVSISVSAFVSICVIISTIYKKEKAGRRR